MTRTEEQADESMRHSVWIKQQVEYERQIRKYRESILLLEHRIRLMYAAFALLSIFAWAVALETTR